MKKRIVLTSFTALALTAGSFAFAFSLKESNKVEEADAYSAVTVSNLPTTLSLKDNTNSEIKSYYSSLSNKSYSELQGTNLLKNLKTLLSTNQIYYSYDDGSGKSNSIWCLYEIIDRDWTKSPVSDITNSSKSTYISGASYNSTTKTLTGYKYTVTDPYVHALYVDRDYDSGITAWGNHSPRTKEWCMEREHIWPKSHGFDTELTTTGGARGDPMHLWAAEGYSNGIHSNNYYGNVDKTKSYTDCGDYSLTTYTTYSTTEYAHHNYSGTSKSLGSGTVFEPQDCDKGDIARAVFYMAARYNNYAGATSGIDANDPNIRLNDVINTTSGTSTASQYYNYGLLHDLLEWHHADPVDEFEIHRNNLLFNNYTNNRNPFIDYPEWADYIWGLPESNMTYSAPTGSVDLDNDVINGYRSGGSSETVSVTGISLDTNSKSLSIGDELQLNATISPSNATDKTISWTSSDANAATVSNGLITAVAVGSATITVTTTDGGFTATCNITVTESSSTGDIEEGNVTAVSGAFDGWTPDGLGSGYADGSAKFDSSGDNVYKLDIFSGDVSDYMTSLEVTLTGKINGTPGETNAYKVEAISGTSISDLEVKKSSQKTGSDIFTSSSSDVVFSLNDDLEGTTGLRITYVTKGGGNLALSSISWTATYEKSAVEPTSGDATFVSSEQDYIDKSTVSSGVFSNENITVSFSKSTGSTYPTYYSDQSSVRCYSNNTITVSSTKQNLYTIIFTFGSGDGNNTISVSTGTYSSEDKTWTSASNTYVQSVTFTIGSLSGNNRRIFSLAVNYYNATLFATDFLSTVVCDGTGNTAPSTSNWSTMSTRAGYLFDQDKDALRTANLVENGTVIEQAMYRYNYIISKYGAATYNNFLTRTISSSNVNFSLFNEDSNMIFIIVLVSVISAASIGCLFFIKKRKTSK